MAETKTETKAEATPVVNFDVQAGAKGGTGSGPDAKSAAAENRDSKDNGHAASDAKPEQSSAGTDRQPDKPAEGSTASKPDGQAEKKADSQSEPKPEPKLDPETEKLVKSEVDARLKSSLEEALNAKMEALLEVNRQLGLFLGEQMEIAIGLRQSVTAMERLLESDARRKGKYAAMLEQVKSEGDGMADPHWINRTRGMLSQLKRTGTTGPKAEGHPQGS